MTKLTKAQRARLEKLAAYLEGLPKRYRHFDMASWYSEGDGATAEIEYGLRNGGVKGCGTVACALGHGPAAGVLVPKSMIDLRYGIEWGEYMTLFGVEHGSLEDRWVFGASWDSYDRHHWAAAARIRHFLHRGVPDGFEFAGREWKKLYRPYRIDAHPVHAADPV